MNDHFTFNPIPDKKDTVTSDLYCLKGNEDFVDNDGYPNLIKDSNKVLAKKITRTNSQPQYFIKLSNNHKLFNPLGAGLEDRAYSIIDNVCRPSDKFKAVNENVFIMYLNFLSSKNLSWLNKAERETI